MMKTNAELMIALKEAQDEIRPLVDAGDEDAHIRWAFGKALYEYLAEGHRLTDLDWFKGTTYYTGPSADSDIPKAA